MTLPIVEALHRFRPEAELVHEAADTIETLYEALKVAKKTLDLVAISKRGGPIYSHALSASHQVGEAIASVEAIGRPEQPPAKHALNGEFSANSANAPQPHEPCIPANHTLIVRGDKVVCTKCAFETGFNSSGRSA